MRLLEMLGGEYERLQTTLWGRKRVCQAARQVSVRLNSGQGNHAGASSGKVSSLAGGSILDVAILLFISP